MTDVYYSVNGVNIGDTSLNSMGWVLLRGGTTALGGITRAITSVVVPGYDGYFQAPSRNTEQTLVFNIKTPRENLEALMAVLANVGSDSAFPRLGVITVSTDADRAAYYELVSAIPSSVHPSDRLVTVTATLNIPYGGWRDKTATVTDAAIPTNPTIVTTIGSGISLPVRDMDVFIQGDVGTMQITDSAGSWLRTTNDYTYSSGYGLFYQGATGRAFQATDAAPFTPVADLGFAVDASGGGFKMTPYFDPTTPNTRSVQLSVLSTQVSDVAIKVRWRGAYVLK